MCDPDPAFVTGRQVALEHMMEWRYTGALRWGFAARAGFDHGPTKSVQPAVAGRSSGAPVHETASLRSVGPPYDLPVHRPQIDSLQPTIMHRRAGRTPLRHCSNVLKSRCG